MHTSCHQPACAAEVQHSPAPPACQPPACARTPSPSQSLLPTIAIPPAHHRPPPAHHRPPPAHHRNPSCPPLPAARTPSSLLLLAPASDAAACPAPSPPSPPAAPPPPLPAVSAALLLLRKGEHHDLRQPQRHSSMLRVYVCVRDRSVFAGHPVDSEADTQQDAHLRAGTQTQAHARAGQRTHAHARTHTRHARTPAHTRVPVAISATRM